MKRSIFFIFLLAWTAASFRCSSDESTSVSGGANAPPEIVELSATPTAIGKRQTTTLLVQAVDQDNDPLQYAWSASAGVFLQGTDRKYAVWQAPDALGRYECQVAVDDGTETATGKIFIEVAPVAILQVSHDALDYSYTETERVVTLENKGAVDLHWQAQPVQPWIQASPDQGVLAAAEQCQVRVTLSRAGLVAGEYIGLVGVRSDGGDRDIAVYQEVAMIPTMLQIAAGNFTMGSQDGASDERPAHTVFLESFSIDRYEVTNAQYADFLNQLHPEIVRRSAYTAVIKDGVPLIYLYPIYREGRNVGCPILYDNGRFEVERHEANTPVRFTTWHGAIAFARFHGKRLPTEAEWEKAARGTNAAVYPWGEAAPTRWYSNYDDRLGYLTRVGSYSPLGDSPYGCADMAGNVWEWCSSLYWPYPYQATDGREDATAEGYRVLRGGAWDSPSINLRSSLRSFNDPLYQHPSFGFRCAK